jgi:integrase
VKANGWGGSALGPAGCQPTARSGACGGGSTVGFRLVQAATELKALRLQVGVPNASEPIIPAHHGGYWAEHDWRSWRRRVFQPAADAVGLGTIRPCDLRHSFVSLLIAEGRNIVDVARQAGHSPSMALDTYGHVFDELDGDKRRPAEEVIRKARAKVIREAGAPSVHPRQDDVAPEENETPRLAELS